MLSLFFAPLTFIIFGNFTSIPLLFGLYILSGLGMAGIGMSVMHDAIHGSYSKNKTLNTYLGYTLNLIGANARVWHLQHNILHHTYTNIEAADDDINTPPFLRFSPHTKNNKWHKYQHWYTWFFYALSTLSWITTKDFVRLKRYYKMGMIHGKKSYQRGLFKILFWKLLYYTYVVILPIAMSAFPFWIVILAFISMHFVTGLIISSVFQIAHVMSNVTYPIPDAKGTIDSEWMIHQMATTSNFSINSSVFSWLIGGLNYQVEHHLFPKICHIHYRKIAPIVKQTAEEFGIPYLYKKTFTGALYSHFKMLRYLGHLEVSEV